jgi:hypothetical protein
MHDLDLNIRHGVSSFVSFSPSTAPATASATSAFGMLGCPQESSEQSGTSGSTPGAGEVGPLVLPMSSRLPIITEIEGTAPPLFDGTGVAARRWFKRAENHFFVNQQSTAAKDPLRKIGITLSWICGPRVDYWVDRQIDWLKDQEHGRNAVADPWAVFQQAFLESFSSLSDVRRAETDLKKLRMKNGDVDGYIGAFANLADLAQVPLDSPHTLEMFQVGLPIPFVMQCWQIAKDWPKTFMEWCTLARRHQANKDHLNSRRANRQMTDTGNNDDKTLWTRNRGNTQQAQVSLTGSGRRESVASIGVSRKAVTEEDKAKYYAEGRCFRCSEQGHISRNCPSRVPQVPIAMV